MIGTIRISTITVFPTDKFITGARHSLNIEIRQIVFVATGRYIAHTVGFGFCFHQILLSRKERLNVGIARSHTVAVGIFVTRHAIAPAGELKTLVGRGGNAKFALIWFFPAGRYTTHSGAGHRGCNIVFVYFEHSIEHRVACSTDVCTHRVGTGGGAIAPTHEVVTFEWFGRNHIGTIVADDVQPRRRHRTHRVDVHTGSNIIFVGSKNSRVSGIAYHAYLCGGIRRAVAPLYKVVVRFGCSHDGSPQAGLERTALALCFAVAHIVGLCQHRVGGANLEHQRHGRVATGHRAQIDGFRARNGESPLICRNIAPAVILRHRIDIRRIHIANRLRYFNRIILTNS